MIGEENSYLYRTSLYLAASASAEFFADIALSPMESVKVRSERTQKGIFCTLEKSFSFQDSDQSRGNLPHHSQKSFPAHFEG